MNRVQQLQEKMQSQKIESFLVMNPYNLRYLTGFTGSTGVALITQKQSYFITDFRYTEQAAAQCVGFEIIQNTIPILQVVGQLTTDLNVQNTAFESNFISFEQYSTLESEVTHDLIPTVGIIEGIREIKDDDEIGLIKKACQIADAAFSHILTYIQPGLTEIQVANELDFFMRKQGASGVSFDTIVASGVRSALPHGVATHKVIEKGDFITLDFGCYYEGYVSDMTRTISIGEPCEKLRDIYQIVKDAQLKVIEQARAGISGKVLDAVARDYITSHGYGEAFGHSTGHGIGLEVHEGPNVSRLSEHIFAPGNVITDEPGIYLPGLGGVRIEDDLLITENGIENLTHSTKDLIIL